VPERVNANLYVTHLFPELMEDSECMLPNNNFVFQQDDSLIHLSHLAQKNGSSSIVRSSSGRMCGHQTHLTSVLSTTASGALCSSGAKTSLDSQPTKLNLKRCRSESVKTFLKRLSTWLCYHPGRDNKRAFEKMMVPLSTYSNRIGSVNKWPFSGPKNHSNVTRI